MNRVILLVLSLLLLLGLIFSCTENAHKTTEVKPIVLIFDSIKSNYDTLFFAGGASALMEGPILSLKLSAEFGVNLILRDTIQFDPVLDYVIITHKYLPYSSIDFILKAGDTARIKYFDEIPYIDILNRETKSLDVNYDYFKREHYPVIENMSVRDIIYSPYTLYSRRVLDKAESSILPFEIRNEYYPKYLEELKDESIWLDSLYREEQISDMEYNFYKERNKYWLLDQELSDKTIVDLADLLKEYNDSSYRQDVARYYKNHFYQVGTSYMNAISMSIEGQPFIKSYDYIDTCHEITGQLALDIKRSYLNYILPAYPLEVRREYFDKYASSVSDTVLICSLEKVYENLLNPEIAASENVVLLSADNEWTNLSEVLNQCVGKIVYVDFWASWCAPCLREMPVSRKLREDPAYKDVVFIYLAINDREDAWKATWEKAELAEYSHNYLILNSQDAPFIKDNQIDVIPRYMIFDRTGNLIINNAASPSDENLSLLGL